jgi:predicted MPP superfamily phosphohydrolase
MLGAYGYASRIERHSLTTEQVTLDLPGLPDELAGLRIVQISDLHLRPITEAAMIEKTVQALNALKPDLIMVTGDFITVSGKDAGELADILAGLKAPHGVYGVLGNHDVWHQPWLVAMELRRAGLRLLVNEGEGLLLGGKALWIAGTDSVWAGKPDLAKALPKDPKMPTVLMVHEPDYADTVALAQRPVIQLSGHSHGGQVRVPFIGAPVTVSHGKKYVRGLHRVGDVRLYVNRGIGCTSLGVRFACPPEITEIKLERGEG